MKKLVASFLSSEKLLNCFWIQTLTSNIITCMGLGLWICHTFIDEFLSNWTLFTESTQGTVINFVTLILKTILVLAKDIFLSSITQTVRLLTYDHAKALWLLTIVWIESRRSLILNVWIIIRIAWVMRLSWSYCLVTWTHCPIPTFQTSLYLVLSWALHWLCWGNNFLEQIISVFFICIIIYNSLTVV